MSEDLFKSIPRVRPARLEDLPALQQAAAEDDHCVIAPTHLILKDSEIVGYMSICATPVVNAWVSTKKVKARDSITLLSVAESLAESKGEKRVILTCAQGSPFYPLMERFGYKRLGYTSLNLKSF